MRLNNYVILKFEIIYEKIEKLIIEGIYNRF